MLKKRLFVYATFFAVLGGMYYLKAQGKEPTKQANWTISILPQVSLTRQQSGRTNNDPKLSIELRNTSETPFFYIQGGMHGNPLGLLYLELFKDGKKKVPREYAEGPDLARKNVRKLKPNQAIVFEWAPKVIYGELEAGRYLLRAYYKVTAGEFPNEVVGLTPLSIDSDLMWIAVE